MKTIERITETASINFVNEDQAARDLTDSMGRTTETLLKRARDAGDVLWETFECEINQWDVQNPYALVTSAITIEMSVQIVVERDDTPYSVDAYDEHRSDPI